MPTQTKFICPSGGSNVDLSGIFEDLNGGTSYGTATKFKVGSVDLTGYFHASSGGDTPSFNTGFKVNGTDLSAIFRRRGFVGLSITSQPSNQIINNNSSATFSVTATASGTPTYQWYGPSGLISGATNSSYTISTATIANDGSYYCAVSYGGSTINSNSALLKIKPYIVTQPSALYVNDGVGPYAVQVTAGGSQNLYFQWFRNSVARNTVRVGNLSSTQDQDVFNPVNSSNTGNYYCKVTSDYDAVGAQTSTVSVSIIPPLVSAGITGYSAPFIFNYNTVVTLTATITQGTNISYQWYGPDGIINGATSANYIFTLSAGNDGAYYVVATNGGGSATSNTINVYVNPYITSNPSSTTVTAGGNAVFTVGANGSGTLTYQWYRNGSPLGASNPSFADVNVTSAYNGYTYYCVVSSNISGTSAATSTTATLTVNYAPTNASISGQTSYYVGNQMSFTASVTLGNPTTTTYTWQRSTNNGVSWSQVAQNTTTSSSNQYDPGAATGAMVGYQYRCVINNSIGSVTTSALTLYIIATVTVEPVNTTVNEGGTAVFSLTAEGNSAITYQWYREGSAIGASANAFADSNRQRANNGDEYYCVVSNAGGSDTSATRTLTVAYVTEQYNPDSNWYNLPGNGQINLYDNLLQAIKVVPQNYTSNSYQWQKYDGTNWNNISGANGNELVWNPITTADAGTYRCVISNSLNGSPMYSQSFIITVI